MAENVAIFHVAQVLAPGTAGHVTIVGKKEEKLGCKSVVVVSKICPPRNYCIELGCL